MDSAKVVVTHSEHKRNTMLEFQKLFPGARIWNNETGVARSMDGARIVKYGFVGSADLTGIMPDGIRVEIEIKVKKDRQRESQAIFEKVIRQCNGIYFIVDDKSEIKEQLCRNLKRYLEHLPQNISIVENQ